MSFRCDVMTVSHTFGGIACGGSALRELVTFLALVWLYVEKQHA